MFRRAQHFRNSPNLQSRNWGIRDFQTVQASQSGGIISKDYDYHDIDRGMENYHHFFSENEAQSFYENIVY